MKRILLGLLLLFIGAAGQTNAWAESRDWQAAQDAANKVINIAEEAVKATKDATHGIEQATGQAENHAEAHVITLAQQQSDQREGAFHHQERPEQAALVALEQALGAPQGIIKVIPLAEIAYIERSIQNWPRLRYLGGESQARRANYPDLEPSYHSHMLHRAAKDNWNRPTAYSLDGKIVALALRSYNKLTNDELFRQPQKTSPAANKNFQPPPMPGTKEFQQYLKDLKANLPPPDPEATKRLMARMNENYMRLSLPSFEPLKAFSNLKALRLYVDVDNYSGLSKLTGLQELEVGTTPYGQNQFHLELPPNLKSLWFSRKYASQLQLSLGDAAKLEYFHLTSDKLSSLKLGHWPQVKTIDGRYTDLGEFSFAQDKSGNLGSLRDLGLTFLKPVKGDWLSALACPERLFLQRLELPNDFNTSCLTDIKLNGGQAIQSLAVIQSAAKLKWMELDTSEAADLAVLDKFPQLAELKISNVERLSFGASALHGALRTLTIEDSAANNIDGIQSLVALKTLDIESLRLANAGLESVAELPCLVQLKQSQTRRAKELLKMLGPNWKNMHNLQTVSGLAADGIGGRTWKQVSQLPHEQLIADRYDAWVALSRHTHNNHVRMHPIPEAEQCIVERNEATGEVIAARAAQQRQSYVYKARLEDKPLPPGYQYLYVRPTLRIQYGDELYRPDVHYAIHLDHDSPAILEGRTDRDGVILETLPGDVDSVVIALGFDTKRPEIFSVTIYDNETLPDLPP